MSFITTYPILKDVALADLALSDLNPRKEIDPEGIAALADSIRVNGLMQNLAGLVMGEGMTLIVAGGRRLRALQMLQAAGEGPGAVPVLLTDDIDQARAWAMAENIARIDLNPADEIGAYAASARAGQTIPQIAAAFGVTELQVQRRLKLATLDERAVKHLRAGEINMSQAAALLMCSGEEQFENALESAVKGVSANHLRSNILSGSVTARDKRVQFLGLDVYRAAGGVITTDLFSDDVVIEDVSLLDRLFEEAVAAKASEYLEEGWKWAEFSTENYLHTWEIARTHQRIWPQEGELDPKSAERYQYLLEKERDEGLNKGDQAEIEVYERGLEKKFTAAQRQVAGVFFCIQRDGAVQVEKGWVRSSDMSDAIAAGVIQENRKDTADQTAAETSEKSLGFSAALTADLRAIHLSALQEAILAKPGLTRKVLAYGLANSVGRPFDVVVSDQPNAPKIEDGWEQAPALEHDGRTVNGWDHAEHMSLDELTIAIANKLIRGMIYGFSFGSTLPEWRLLLDDAGADMRARWRPTKENFFSRVQSPYLDQVFNHIFDLTPDHPNARDFAKMKKGEKANLLHMLFDPQSQRKAYHLMSDAALARIEAWTPEFE